MRVALRSSDRGRLVTGSKEPRDLQAAGIGGLLRTEQPLQ
jgi:hypothetical protein